MNYPKKLKVGDEVVIKLAPTHLRYHSGLRGYIRGQVNTVSTVGILVWVNQEVAKALGTSVIAIDNTPGQRGYWDGLVIRYLGSRDEKENK